MRLHAAQCIPSTTVSTQSRPLRVSSTPRTAYVQFGNSSCESLISLLAACTRVAALHTLLAVHMEPWPARGQSLSPYFISQSAICLPSQHGKPRKHRSISDRS